MTSTRHAQYMWPERVRFVAVLAGSSRMCWTRCGVSTTSWRVGWRLRALQEHSRRQASISPASTTQQALSWRSSVQRRLKAANSSSSSSSNSSRREQLQLQLVGPQQRLWHHRTGQARQLCKYNDCWMSVMHAWMGWCLWDMPPGLGWAVPGWFDTVAVHVPQSVKCNPDVRLNAYMVSCWFFVY